MSEANVGTDTQHQLLFVIYLLRYLQKGIMVFAHFPWSSSTSKSINFIHILLFRQFRLLGEFIFCIVAAGYMWQTAHDPDLSSTNLQPMQVHVNPFIISILKPRI